LTDVTPSSSPINAEGSSLRLGNGDERLLWLRRTLALTILVLSVGVYQFGQLAFRMGVIPSSWKWTLALVASTLGVIALVVLLFMTWTRLNRNMVSILSRCHQLISRLGILNLLMFLPTLAVFPLLILGSYGMHFVDVLLRFSILWVIALFGAALLAGVVPNIKWSHSLAVSLLLNALVYRATLFIPAVSTFPFSLGYSEGSRYYFASLFFSEKIYGISDVALPALHPTRYMLQSLPFLISGLPLWFHRLWQVLLWFVTSTAASALFVRRLSLQPRTERLLWFMWAILFLFQGPVYYHLMLMVILILWGVDSERFTRSLIVVILASIWAGMSRLNWVPVPGLLAATLYFLERQKPERSSTINYLTVPFLWVVLGTSIAFGAQELYASFSGTQGAWLASSLNSPLLWYRLFPSATNPTGVLQAIFIASAAPLWIFISQAVGKRGSWHPIRPLALAGILIVLFTGGLVVSTKIGGGDDLHNLDAFLVHLMIISAYMIFGRVTQDKGDFSTIKTPTWQVLSLLIAIPIISAIGLGAPSTSPDKEQAERALSRLEEIVSETIENGGEVLFIAERHLITFHQIEGVVLLPEYEKTFLMEMAMSSNQTFFEAFNADLKAGRYDLIITEPPHLIRKGRDYIFGEEDDAWVDNVSVRLLRFYQTNEVIETGRERIAIMEPKS
jgi:hypothetical protein